jgi:hypothetical protein
MMQLQPWSSQSNLRSLGYRLGALVVTYAIGGYRTKANEALQNLHQQISWRLVGFGQLLEASRYQTNTGGSDGDT